MTVNRFNLIIDSEWWIVEDNSIKSNKYRNDLEGDDIYRGLTEGELTEKEVVDLLNELYEENYKIKSILLQRVEELNDAYNKSAKAGMPTGGIIGELDSFEEICEDMGWLE